MDELPAGLEWLAWRRDDGPPTPDAVRRRLRAEGVEPYAWSNGPDDSYGMHEHGYTKLLMCAEGSITFLVGPKSTRVELAPGEGFVLPAGVSHAAIVGARGCTCLEGTRPRMLALHLPGALLKPWFGPRE
jgi:hypothetical protein